MAYLTTTLLKTFSNKVPDDDTLLQNYCDAAEQIIEEFLGYSPESATYTTEAYGLDSKYFALEAKPITAISAITIDGESGVTTDFKIVKNSNYIAFDDESLFDSGVKYSVTYTAGYSTVPAPIVTAGLQIASLLSESEGGNVAVTSTSFLDSASRTYQSFKPDRFLDPISKYKLVEVSY